MKKLSGALLIAAVLVSSSAPALARPGYGYPYGGYRHHRHGGGDGFGNFLLGAIVAGGIIAVASAASKDREARRGRDIESRDRRTWSDGEQRAADACADAAEGVASRRGGDSRVEDIAYVGRDGDGYRVEGQMENGRAFSCGVTDGEISYIQFEDRMALAR